LVALREVAFAKERVFEFMFVCEPLFEEPIFRVSADLERFKVPTESNKVPVALPETTFPEVEVISFAVRLPELSTVKLDEAIKLVKFVPEKLIPVPIVPERVIPLVKVPVPLCEILTPFVVVPPPV
jgi:hypothetical protein